MRFFNYSQFFLYLTLKIRIWACTCTVLEWTVEIYFYDTKLKLNRFLLHALVSDFLKKISRSCTRQCRHWPTDIRLGVHFEPFPKMPYHLSLYLRPIICPKSKCNCGHLIDSGLVPPVKFLIALHDHVYIHLTDFDGYFSCPGYTI